MTPPFEPRDPEVEAALRRSLGARAAEAPGGADLAERILGAVDAPTVVPFTPRRRSYALPAVAAAILAAIVGIAVAVGTSGRDTPPPAAGSSTPAAPPSSSTAATPVVPPPTPAPSTRANPSALHAVHVYDLSFTGTDDGWALASANCIHGSGRCTAIMRTTDGTTWVSHPGSSPFTVPDVDGCTAPCVEHIRFATEQIGYVFGPTALLMTTDGGQSWHTQPGGALALETLDGNVIRVVESGDGCPGPCDVRVQTAGLGSSRWVTSSTPRLDGEISFARGDSDAYLLVRRNPAGGAQNATSTLLRSADDGRTWTAGGEPCPQGTGEVDSYAVTAGADGRVAVLCGTRTAPGRWSVAVSSDHGVHFGARPGVVPPATATLLTGDPGTELVTAASGMAISHDAGASWEPTAVQRPVSFVGFESSIVGRAVTDSGRAIWTTRDGGRTWTEVALP